MARSSVKKCCTRILQLTFQWVFQGKKNLFPDILFCFSSKIVLIAYYGGRIQGFSIQSEHKFIHCWLDLDWFNKLATHNIWWTGGGRSFSFLRLSWDEKLILHIRDTTASEPSHASSRRKTRLLQEWMCKERRNFEVQRLKQLSLYTWLLQ